MPLIPLEQPSSVLNIKVPKSLTMKDNKRRKKKKMVKQQKLPTFLLFCLSDY